MMRLSLQCLSITFLSFINSKRLHGELLLGYLDGQLVETCQLLTNCQRSTSIYPTETHISLDICALIKSYLQPRNTT